MCCEIITPLYLPNSDIIMEKNVIKQHLLNSDSDPFTRKKLTFQELLDYNNNKDISNKLLQFINEKENFKDNFIKTKLQSKL